jgi:4-cresol dehydrogenase (hydroxylating)
MSRLHKECAGTLHVYPISTGYNWGLGSAEPVCDHAVILDLREHDAVRCLDLETGVAVVEPGVTQGRLARDLVGSPYMLNVTASASQTSILGNALERGLGLHRQRVDDLLGLEVVLADGTVQRVGRWPDVPHPTPPYGFPAGPGLSQLFVQSNFGVVTAAVISLIPRPQRQSVVRLHFSARVLPLAVQRLRTYLDNRLVAGVLKIFSDGAKAAYGSAGTSGYTAFIPLAGPTAVVRAAIEWMDADLRRCASFDGWSVLDLDDEGTVTEVALLKGLAGDPTANDAMLRAVFAVSADEVDGQSNQGWLFCAPVVAFTPGEVTRAATLLESVISRERSRDGLVVGHTINVVPQRWIDFVITIRFGRQSEAAPRAHELLHRIHKAFAEAGFPPYRLDIDHVRNASALPGDVGQEDLLMRLKTALDPTALIARGRYV